MNILFLTIAYPESENDRNLYTDLMDEFNNRGNSVFVITSRERRYGRETEFKPENGINVLRVKTGNLQKTNVIEKGIATLLIEKQYIVAIRKYFEDVKFDLVIYSTPPVTFEKTVRYVKKRDGAASYLLLKDIFPQNAVDIGLMKRNSLIHKHFRGKEIKLYKCSDYIGCMSKANVDYLANHNNFINPATVEVCPNSTKPVSLSDNKDIRELRKKYSIPQEAMVFVYGGNLGKPQGIGFLREVLQSNSGQKDRFFLIVGSGTEYGSLEQLVKESRPDNLLLLSSLPKNEYDALLKACDVGMIFLDSRFTIPNFPSRLLSYMENCMPVIAATDENTDIGKVMEEGEFGLWCESGDLEAFNKSLDLLVSDRQKAIIMGQNARAYLEEHYTVSIACDIIMKHFAGR